MKKTIRNLTNLFVMLICIIGMGTTVFATDVQTNSETNLKDCLVTYNVTDTTNSVFVDEITVTLMNIENPDLIYTQKIKSIDYLFGIAVVDNVKHGKYNIALSYPSKESYAIQNADGTAISSFTADSEAHTFNWTIQSKEKSEDVESTPIVDAGSSVEAFISDTGNAEADALWNDFLTTVENIGNDKKSVVIFKKMKDGNNAIATAYERATGKSKDIFNNMSEFEQFLWYTTYVLPKNGSTSQDYDNYRSTFMKWKTNSVGTAISWFDMHGTEEMKSSYLALTEWQYNNLMKGNNVYNFLEESASLDNKEIKEETITLDGKTNDGDPTKEESGKDSIWSETTNLIKENWVTILILLILAGATIGVVVYRKRKTIDDEIK